MGNVLKKYNGTNWDIVGGAVTGDTLPIGAIMPYTSKITPLNWLPCNGQAVSRTDYADLFAIIGTQYGEGDGSTTFNVPDLNDYKVPIGYDRFEEQSSRMNLGTTGGEETHTLTIEEIPKEIWHSSDNTGGVNTYFDNGSNYGAHTQGTNLGQPHNNMQPYVTTNYIIKAFQSSGVVAQVSNTKSDSTTDTYSCEYINKKIDTVESDNQNVENWDIFCKKVGKITQINVTLIGNLSIDGFATVTIGTLADKFKPLTKTPLAGLTHGQTNEQLYVDSNGKVEIFNWGNAVTLSAGEIFVTATYITA